MRRKIAVSLITIILGHLSLFAFEISFSINTENERKPISPYIYGTNQLLTESENWSLRRSGGNRWTGYNWENNASNAGSDWNHSSDSYLGGGNIPGKAITDRHEVSIAANRASLVTIPMAGYVSRDKDGTVTQAQTAPSNRWNKIAFVKPAPFVAYPNLTDNIVYMDEFVNFFVTKYGNASTAKGISGYSLDNEPALWVETHSRLHPEKVRCVELTDRSRDLSVAIKKVDESADIYGPVLYGFNAMTSLQDAPDWDSIQEVNSYEWFVDYYLDMMKKHSDVAGKRLLDVFDIHWYSEAKGDNRITQSNATSQKDRQARVQAPRTLWHEGYIEDSWIGQWGQDFLPLIPAIKKSIDTYYPGTKIAFTEWNYGGEDDISGGIAFADALGIYGKYGVYTAAYWQLWSSTNYSSAAFKLFRNYNGQQGRYGSMSVQSNTEDWEKSSIYAAQQSGTNTNLHVILINKSFTESMDATVSVTSPISYSSGSVWGFDAQQSNITQFQKIENIENNQFTYSVPALSVYHMILSPQGSTIFNSPGALFPNNRFTIAESSFGSLRFSVFLPKAQQVKVDLFDVQGRLVENLYKGYMSAGLHSRTMTTQSASGIYIAAVAIDSEMFHQRISKQ